MNLIQIPQPDTGVGLDLPPQLVTKKVFAHQMSVSVRTVDNWLAAKKIPFIRFSRKIVRIPWPEARDHIVKNYRVNPRN